MGAEIVDRDFTGTTIRKPMEKMRAHAIIRAADDPSGLSMINFNITPFLLSTRKQDAFFILGLWATEPVRRAPGKFVRFPEAGKDALITRTNALMKNLVRREDVKDTFVEEAKIHIFEMIEHEINYMRGEHELHQSA